MWRSAVQLRAGLLYGGIAQLVEHLLCKQGVKSSNLFISTVIFRQLQICGCLFLYRCSACLSDLGTGVLGKCATEWPARPFSQNPLFPSFYMFYLEESEHLSNGIGIHVHHSAELLVACAESAAQQFAYLKSLGDSQQPDGCGAESLQADSGGFPAQFRVA